MNPESMTAKTRRGEARRGEAISLDNRRLFNWMEGVLAGGGGRDGGKRKSCQRFSLKAKKIMSTVRCVGNSCARRRRRRHFCLTFEASHVLLLRVIKGRQVQIPTTQHTRPTRGSCKCWTEQSRAPPWAGNDDAFTVEQKTIPSGSQRSWQHLSAYRGTSSSILRPFFFATVGSCLCLLSSIFHGRNAHHHHGHH